MFFIGVAVFLGISVTAAVSVIIYAWGYTEGYENAEKTILGDMSGEKNDAR